jgi:hypothetical protein
VNGASQVVENLLLGTVVIAATVVIHAVGLIEVTRWSAALTDVLRVDHRRNRIVAMVATVLGTFVVLAVEIWLWALVHFAIGSFGDIETALYFSIVSFSTLGYGDVIPPERWRVFAALEGINGFLLIGWSTAYLIAAGMRIGPFRSGEHF